MLIFLWSVCTLKIDIALDIFFLVLKGAVISLETTLATKNKEISNMQSKLSELQSDLDALGKTFDEKEKQLAILREENRKLKTQVDDANIKVHISLPIFVHKKKLIWIFNTQLHYDSSESSYM